MLDTTLSSEQLIAKAYEADDEEQYWQIIIELHKRGSEVEFRLAEKLSFDEDSVNREIAADILGQLDWPENKFQAQSVSILIEMLNDESPDVVASAAFSLGHRHDERSIDSLLQHLHHKNANVRHGIAFALGGFEEQATIDALIQLAEDDDYDVRNWATFGLGSLSEADSPSIRRALLARVAEEDAEIRGEALIGLARRKEEKARAAIAKELAGKFHGNWAVSAAEIFALPEYENLLLELRERLIADEEEQRFIEDVDKAIAACKIH